MRRYTIILSLLLAAVLFRYSNANSFWPVFQRDSGHTGVAPVSTPGDPEVLWSIDTTAGDTAHLVLGRDGSVWLVGGPVDRFSPKGENTLHILVRDFGLQGEFTTRRGSPVVLPDGTLIAMAGIRNEARQFIATLFAIEPEGDIRWTLPFEGQTSPSSLLSLGPDALIYVGCPTSLYAVSQEGSVAWSYDCESQITTLPAVASDGTVYFGAQNGALYCLASEGRLRWTFCPEGSSMSIDSTPTLGENGRIYFAASARGFYCLDNDGAVQFSYPISRACYTSPILFSDGSVVFHEMTELGPVVTRLEPDGSKRWSALVPGTTQAPLASPAADRDGNVFFTSKDFDPSTNTTCFQFGRMNADGDYALLSSEFAAIGRAGGPCIAQDGTIYCQVGTKLAAFGRRRGTSVGIWTDSPGYPRWPASWVNVSVSITNAEIATPLDCYVAFDRPDSDQLLFYPLWSPDASLAALEFRPLPGDSFFEKIEIAHLPSTELPAGEYRLFAAFFEPGTFNLIGDISCCMFSVYGSRMPGLPHTNGLLPEHRAASDPGETGTAPTISIWTDKSDYVAGEVLHLSLSLANEGMGTGYDLYIAAKLDGDPSGTLFFFPTWATDPAFTNISFLPLAQGASLPELTIMHLELPDALPRGDYTFLAAFFVTGTFELASEVAEARWTLM